MKWIAIATILMAACSSPQPGSGNLREVRLPDGTVIACEVKIRPDEMARGMMYRDQLPPGRGMLFVHSVPSQAPYWMHNVRVPLDIIWIDSDQKIVEISPDTPPCLKDASECPNYGGRVPAQFVLELAGGEAGKHGLKVGDQLRF